LDLQKAVRAEIAVEFTQHIGTSCKRFRVNESDGFDLPLPKNTAGSPECYYHEFAGNPPITIPLEQLHHGSNTFRFAAGPQICHDFGWGLLSVYAFTVRIYYDRKESGAVGEIITPKPGDSLGQFVPLCAEAIAPNCRIRQVDFIGYYKDVDWEGDGTFLGWHYLLKKGRLCRNLGTAHDGSPYSIVWNTEWIPDQDEPIKVMARIVDENGLCTMTPCIEDLRLERDISVRIYNSENIPENFSVRLGRKKSCIININHDLQQALGARLWLPTHISRHYGEEAAEIGLNGQSISDYFGADYQNFDYFPVPLSMLRQGENEFYIQSDTHHHAAEINWPGPVLLIKFMK